MRNKELAKDAEKVDKELQEAVGGTETLKRVKESSTKHGLIKC